MANGLTTGFFRNADGALLVYDVTESEVQACACIPVEWQAQHQTTRPLLYLPPPSPSLCGTHTHAQSFRTLLGWREALRRKLSEGEWDDFPVVIVGNKVDARPDRNTLDAPTRPPLPDDDVIAQVSLVCVLWQRALVAGR
jgi:GTPase SAR1 family protein